MIKENVKIDDFAKLEKKMATKEDLKGMASKEDLKGMASKEDLKGMASKEDLQDLKEFIKDIKHNFVRVNYLLKERIRRNNMTYSSHV